MNRDMEKLCRPRLERLKKARVWMAAILVMAMAVLGFSAYKLIQPVSAQALSLESYITSVSEMGLTYDPATDTYQGQGLEIKFSLPEGKVSRTSKDFSYVYPSGVIVPDSLLNTDRALYDSNNVKAGTYRFQNNGDGTYSVIVSFSDSYVSTINGGAVSGYVNFKSIYKSTIIHEGESTTISFNDQLDLVIPPSKIKHLYDINSYKDGYYDAQNNRLVYTVIVSSHNGTPGTIDYRDQLNANGLSISSLSDVTVEKITLNDYGNWYNVTSASAISVPDLNRSVNDRLITMTLPQLDAVASSDTSACTGYRITYYYSLGNIEAGSYNQATNAVHVSSENKHTGDKVNDSSFKTISIGKDYNVQKSGYISGDVANWTININNTNYDLNGIVVTDTMFGSCTPDQLNIYPREGYVINTDGSGHVANVTFTQINGQPNTNNYVIKYSTPVTGEQMTNTVDVGGKGSSTTIYKPTQPSEPTNTTTVTKNCDSFIPDADYKTALVSWSVSIVIPANTPITQWAYGYDQLTNGYYTYDQVVDLIAQIQAGECFAGSNMTFRLKGTNGSEYTWSAEDTSLYDMTYTGVSFTLNNSEPIVFDHDVRVDLKYFSMSDITLTSGTYKDVSNSFCFVQTGNAYFRYETGSFRKTDANGSTEPTYTISDDGVLSWKLFGTLSNADITDTVTFTDHLPEGVELTSVTINYYGMQVEVSDFVNGVAEGNLDKGDNQYYSNPENAHYTVTIADGVVTVVITKNKTGFNGEPIKETLIPNQQFTIGINCKVNRATIDGYQKGVFYSFDNYATFSYGDRVLEGSQTQWWKEDYQVVRKLGTWDADSSRIHYSITINPDGDDLVVGQDTLSFEDLLSYYIDSNNVNRRAALALDSVKFYSCTKNADGSVSQVDITQTVNWTYGSSIYSDGEYCVHTISATIPDSKYIIVEYDYVIYGNYTTNDYLGVKNTASISGTSYSSTDTKEELKWSAAETSAGVETKYTYQFYKIEEGNFSVPLEGAVFSVCRYSDDSVVKTYTTNAYGTFNISNSDGFYPEDRLYYIVETTAPVGYLLPENAPRYYFYFDSDGSFTLPDDVTSAYNLMRSGAVEYVTNKATPTQISVKKVWLDGYGNVTTDVDVESITIDLYQHDSYYDNTNQPDTLYQTITLSADNNWEATVTDLPISTYHTEGDTVVRSGYSYYIKERGVEGYMVESYVLEGSENSDEILVEKSTPITYGTIIVTNRAINYVLPETGGPGRSNWPIAVGFSVVTLSAVGLIYMLLKKREGDNGNEKA